MLHKIFAKHLEDAVNQGKARRAVGTDQESGPVCILCYERDHGEGHRQWIAEIMEERNGVKVENLGAPQL